MAELNYDERSFWAGVATGARLKGYSAYGTMAGWNPDGDLIVRPVIQGVPRIVYAQDRAYSIADMTDSVNEGTIFREQADHGLLQTVGSVVFARDIIKFTIDSVTETVVSGELS